MGTWANVVGTQTIPVTVASFLLNSVTTVPQKRHVHMTCGVSQFQDYLAPPFSLIRPTLVTQPFTDALHWSKLGFGVKKVLCVFT